MTAVSCQFSLFLAKYTDMPRREQLGTYLNTSGCCPLHISNDNQFLSASGWLVTFMPDNQLFCMLCLSDMLFCVLCLSGVLCALFIRLPTGEYKYKVWYVRSWSITDHSFCSDSNHRCFDAYREQTEEPTRHSDAVELRVETYRGVVGGRNGRHKDCCRG